MPDSTQLVSIIMPVYNAEKYIAEAIQSVIDQSHNNLELVVINDGSTDNSEEIILKFSDKRIRYFKQKNKGVGAARNLGLANIKGQFICFLDADDLLPDHSLTNRLQVFNKGEDVEFVDGEVKAFDSSSANTIRLFKPSFKGNPFEELLSLSGKCFFGLSWMIKKKKNKKYLFDESLTHGEDLFFYLNISKSGIYDHSENIIYQYRQNNASAMANLKGLEDGYFSIANKLKSIPEVTSVQQNAFIKKTRSIMFKSYFSNGQIFRGFKVLLK